MGLERFIPKDTAIWVAIIGFMALAYQAELNRKANIELEEKKAESELFLKAIDINNRNATLQNITYLVRLGLLPKDREINITKISDSIYKEQITNSNINSDTSAWMDLSFIKDKSENLSLFEKQVRGACVEVLSMDSLPQLHLIYYSDYQGNCELWFPKYYCESIVKVKITKKGYMTDQFEMRLPKWGEMDNKFIMKEIMLKKL